MENLQQPRRASFARLIVPVLCLSAGFVLGLLLAKNSSETPTAVAESKLLETIATSPAKNKFAEHTRIRLLRFKVRSSDCAHPNVGRFWRGNFRH